MQHMQEKKYQKLKAAGTALEVLKAQMLEAGIPEEEVDAFIAAPPPDPKKDDAQGNQGDLKDTPVAQPPKKNAKKAASVETETQNTLYEEWKMDRSFDAQGKIVLEKARKLRDNVKITSDRADRLNEHAENRLVKYFPKSN